MVSHYHIYSTAKNVREMPRNSWSILRYIYIQDYKQTSRHLSNTGMKNTETYLKQKKRDISTK
jgi:hypothetical protein